MKVQGWEGERGAKVNGRRGERSEWGARVGGVRGV